MKGWGRERERGGLSYVWVIVILAMAQRHSEVGGMAPIITMWL